MKDISRRYILPDFKLNSGLNAAFRYSPKQEGNENVESLLRHC